MYAVLSGMVSLQVLGYVSPDGEWSFLSAEVNLSSILVLLQSSRIYLFAFGHYEKSCDCSLSIDIKTKVLVSILSCYYLHLFQMHNKSIRNLKIALET